MTAHAQSLLARIRVHGAIPRHVAIFMDGNGRWARERMLPRPIGHRNGMKAVRDASDRNCGVTQSLPFRSDRLPDVAYSCEVTDSFFERIIDRFRGQDL